MAEDGWFVGGVRRWNKIVLSLATFGSHEEQ